MSNASSFGAQRDGYGGPNPKKIKIKKYSDLKIILKDYANGYIKFISDSVSNLSIDEFNKIPFIEMDVVEKNIVIKNGFTLDIFRPEKKEKTVTIYSCGCSVFRILDEDFIGDITEEFAEQDPIFNFIVKYK